MNRLELSASKVTIDPGNTGELSVSVNNRSGEEDSVALEVEGLDVEWYMLPVPTLHLPAGETVSATILFRIPRTSECLAGTYPFVVRARSMEAGSTAVQQASIVIRPFSSIAVEVDPKRVVSTFFRRSAALDVQLTNTGNKTEKLDLYAGDPEDACAYDFETSRIEIKPGGTATVPLYVEPLTRPILGSTRLYGSNVTARSVDDAFVSASTTLQIERRPLLSTLSAIILIVLASAVGLWALLRPRPVAILDFSAAPAQVLAGDPVKLTWNIANFGDGSFIAPGNIPIKQPVGSVDVTPGATMDYTLVARGWQEQQRKITVVVTPRPPAPQPRIVKLEASPARVHQGDTVTLSWEVQGANTVWLSPLGKKDDARGWRGQQVTPDQTTVYELTAQGSGSDVVTRSVKVEVVPPNVSTAEITSFKAKPPKIEIGKKTKLTWTVVGAQNVAIDPGIGDRLAPNGEFEVQPQATTVYTLRATDRLGNPATLQLTVTVLPPIPNPEAPTPGPDAPPPGIQPGTPPR